MARMLAVPSTSSCIRKPQRGLILPGVVWGRFCAAVFLGIGAACAYATPINLPTTTDTVISDLNPGNEVDILPANPGLPALPVPVVGNDVTVWRTGQMVTWEDTVDSPDLHFWEIQIHNPNVAPVMFNLGVAYPRGGILATLYIAPQQTFYMGVCYDDKYPDFPSGTKDTGWWLTLVKSYLSFEIGVDWATTEGPTAYNKQDGAVYWGFVPPQLPTMPWPPWPDPGPLQGLPQGPGNEFINNQVDPGLQWLQLSSQAVPEPVTLLGLVLGLGALAGYVRGRWGC